MKALKPIVLLAVSHGYVLVLGRVRLELGSWNVERWNSEA